MTTPPTAAPAVQRYRPTRYEAEVVEDGRTHLVSLSTEPLYAFCACCRSRCCPHADAVLAHHRTTAGAYAVPVGMGTPTATASAPAVYPLAQGVREGAEPWE